MIGVNLMKVCTALRYTLHGLLQAPSGYFWAIYTLAYTKALVS